MGRKAGKPNYSWRTKRVVQLALLRGASQADLARQYNLHPDTVRLWARHAGIPSVGHRPFANRDKEEIIAASYRANEKVSVISAETGISEHAVLRVVRRLGMPRRQHYLRRFALLGTAP